MRNHHYSSLGSKRTVEHSTANREREIQEAARALVEAASWGYYARCGQFLGDDTKDHLVAAVVENPLLIEQLFARDGFHLH